MILLIDTVIIVFLVGVIYRYLVQTAPQVEIAGCTVRLEVTSRAASLLATLRVSRTAAKHAADGTILVRFAIPDTEIYVETSASVPRSNGGQTKLRGILSRSEDVNQVLAEVTIGGERAFLTAVVTRKQA